jgi:hypothetical protein
MATNALRGSAPRGAHFTLPDELALRPLVLGVSQTTNP